MSSQTAQDLRQAKQYLIDYGWCQGSYVDTYGCVCASGALRISTGILLRRGGSTGHWYATQVEGAPYERFFDALDALLRVIYPQWIAAFNDDPNTTKEEILAKFDEAIANEEASE